MFMTKVEYRKLKKQLYDYEELLRKEECEKEYLNMLPFENKYFEAGDIYFKIIKVEPQLYLLVSEEKGAICECLTITDNSIKIEKMVLSYSSYWCASEGTSYGFSLNNYIAQEISKEKFNEIKKEKIKNILEKAGWQKSAPMI